VSITVSPKLLRHTDGKLYAYRGLNEIAYRFGDQIRVAAVRRSFGPFYLLGPAFFDSIFGYRSPGAKEGSADPPARK